MDRLIMALHSRCYGQPMRYAIKTSPQYTTWHDMLSVWQAADQMEQFHSAWNFDHFYPDQRARYDRALHGSVDHAGRDSPRRPGAFASGAWSAVWCTGTRRCSPT